MLRTIQKRDGRTVEFNLKKITDAIYKAAQAIGGKLHLAANGQVVGTGTLRQRGAWRVPGQVQHAHRAPGLARQPRAAAGRISG